LPSSRPTDNVWSTVSERTSGRVGGMWNIMCVCPGWKLNSLPLDYRAPCPKTKSITIYTYATLKQPIANGGEPDVNNCHNLPL